MSIFNAVSNKSISFAIYILFPGNTSEANKTKNK